MNFFVEGLQGSGKSTMVRKLSELNPDYTAVREGEYSPVELSWCAYVNSDNYKEILNRYPDLRSEIGKKTYKLMISGVIWTSSGRKDQTRRETNCGIR